MDLGFHFVNFTLPGAPGSLATALAETARIADDARQLVLRRVHITRKRYWLSMGGIWGIVLGEPLSLNGGPIRSGGAQ